MNATTFSLLGKTHTLEVNDDGYLVDGVKLEFVMKREDNFSKAFKALLYVKGLQALIVNKSSNKGV